MTTLAFQIRSNEGCAPQPILAWDTVWDSQTGMGDWAYASASETHNKGGLQAEHALETAVILCLFTDRRCPAEHPLAWLVENDDPRGWWGDGVDVRADLGEAEMGSLLWLLERAPLTENIAQWARSFAIDALAVLIGQQAVTRIDVQTELQPTSRLNLAVQLYGRDGAKLYDRRFDDIWRQEFGGFGDAGATTPGGFSDGFSDGFG